MDGELPNLSDRTFSLPHHALHRHDLIPPCRFLDRPLISHQVIHRYEFNHDLQIESTKFNKDNRHFLLITPPSPRHTYTREKNPVRTNNNIDRNIFLGGQKKTPESTQTKKLPPFFRTKTLPREARVGYTRYCNGVFRDVEIPSLPTAAVSPVPSLPSLRSRCDWPREVIRHCSQCYKIGYTLPDQPLVVITNVRTWA